MIISFCGHSDFCGDLTVAKKVKELIISFAEINKIVYCYTGGYGAFDNFVASCISEAQAVRNNIKNCLVIPYISEWFMNKIKNHVSMYDEVIYPPIEGVPPKYAIIRRNEWMVDKSDLLIAYVKHGWGGAARMYQYAKRRGVKIIALFGE